MKKQLFFVFLFGALLPSWSLSLTSPKQLQQCCSSVLVAETSKISERKTELLGEHRNLEHKKLIEAAFTNLGAAHKSYFALCEKGSDEDLKELLQQPEVPSESNKVCLELKEVNKFGGNEEGSELVTKCRTNRNKFIEELVDCIEQNISPSPTSSPDSGDKKRPVVDLDKCCASAFDERVSDREHRNAELFKAHPANQKQALDAAIKELATGDMLLLNLCKSKKSADFSKEFNDENPRRCIAFNSIGQGRDDGRRMFEDCKHALKEYIASLKSCSSSASQDENEGRGHTKSRRNSNIKNTLAQQGSSNGLAPK